MKTLFGLWLLATVLIYISLIGGVLLFATEQATNWMIIGDNLLRSISKKS